MSTMMITPVQLITNGNMATTVTSAAINRSFSDNIGFQFQWTGTPTGVFKVQTSLSYNPATGSGFWDDYPFSPALTAPSGSAGHFSVEMEEVTAAFLRVVYTPTSGSGSLNVWTNAKSI